MKCLWFALLALSGLAIALPAPAAAQDPVTLSILSVDDSKFPNVTAVLAADQRGVPIPDIALRELQIEESGAPALPISLQRAVESDIPLAIVVVLDVSGSMREGDAVGKAKAAATTLINNLRPIDQAGLISFADSVKVEQPLSPDRAATVAAISRLQGLDAGTALYDAVGESARLAASTGAPRRAVIFLTDGVEPPGQFARSRATREESLGAAAASQSLFYVVGLGTDVDNGYLEELARRSGGRYFPAPGAADVPDVYAAMENVLRSHAVLTLRSNAPAKPDDRSLVVTLSRGQAEVTARVDYASRRPDVPEDAGQSSGGLLPAILAFAAVLLIPLLIIVWRRRRTLREPSGRLTGQGDVIVATTGPSAGPGGALLRLVQGAEGAAEEGAAFVVRDAPAAVGWGPSCAIQLPVAPGLAAEHARVWLRDARLMLHHVAPGYITELAGVPVTWASLNEGDEVHMGPYTLRYVGTPEAHAVASTSGGLQLSVG